MNGTDSSQTNDLPFASQVPLAHRPESLSHLVSVVIPAFNAEGTIEDTLTSVRNQTHSNLEIIVVDDGSTDRTRSIVETHASLDPRVTVISRENAGVAAARNVGWKSAHSEFIAFIDADDLWSPRKIEKQLGVMLAGDERIGLVYTWFAIIDERNRVRSSVPGRYIDGNVIEYAFTENFVGNASSPLIRRRALEEVGGYDSALRAAAAQGCEDMQLYYRIARRFHFGLVPEYLTGYRVVAHRMSSDRLRMLRSFILVADEMKHDRPEFAQKIGQGIRYYLRFLVGEALAFRDFRQAWLLLFSPVLGGTWDRFGILLSVLWEKISWLWSRAWWCVRWVGRAVTGHTIVREDTIFSIGE
jgi:glycosyltransferase involved in cell wall biosynthesis